MRQRWIAHFKIATLLSSTLIGYTQAKPAGVQTIRIQAFGMLSGVDPKYGGAKKNIGATVGGDVNIGGWGRLEPSVEVRVLGSGGRVSNQYAYSFGPRAELKYGNFHPYVDVLIGYGKIVYNNPQVFNGVPYKQDNSLVYSYGGGLDYLIGEHWAIRVDAQGQRWHVGQSDAPFYPLAGSIGVRYRFHFHDRYSPH